MLAKYKANTLYKHARNSEIDLKARKVLLAYNTSKFYTPISLLIVFVTLSLSLVSHSPHTTSTPQLCYLSNLSGLVLIPFLAESILVL